MKVKEGDVIEFLAISWNEPQWEFDHPTLVLKPVIRYSPNGTSPETMIEDLAIDLACGYDIQNEDVSEEFKWRRWDLKRISKIAEDILEGKDVWKTKKRSVIKQEIKFFNDFEDELDFQILESKEM